MILQNFNILMSGCHNLFALQFLVSVSRKTLTVISAIHSNNHNQAIISLYLLNFKYLLSFQYLTSRTSSAGFKICRNFFSMGAINSLSLHLYLSGCLDFSCIHFMSYLSHLPCFNTVIISDMSSQPFLYFFTSSLPNMYNTFPHIS